MYFASLKPEEFEECTRVHMHPFSRPCAAGQNRKEWKRTDSKESTFSQGMAAPTTHSTVAMCHPPHQLLSHTAQSPLPAPGAPPECPLTITPKVGEVKQGWVRRPRRRFADRGGTIIPPLRIYNLRRL